MFHSEIRETDKIREMIIEGLAAVSRGDNPMMVQDKLQAFIAPKQRQELKATG